jgi:transposase
MCWWFPRENDRPPWTYAGYNSHQGLHQRCWVHYLRDVHDLKKNACPDHQELSSWAKAVKDLYEEAVD